MLACCDHMGALVEGVAAGEPAGSPELLQQGEPLVVQLRAYLDAPKAQADPAKSTQYVPTAETEKVQRINGEGVNADHWHISVRFGQDVLRNGMDPLSFIRYLGTMGKIIGIATLTDALPNAEQMDPEICYLGFEIAFPEQGRQGGD